jgi:hypothetical protein
MERVLEKDPKHSEAMSCLGQLLINEAKAAAADAKAESQSADQTMSSDVPEKAKSLMREGMEWIGRCYSLNPHNCGALLALSEYYYLRNELAIAEKFAERSLMSATTTEAKAQANFLLGRLAHRNAEFDKAYLYVSFSFPPPVFFFLARHYNF